MVSSYYLKIKFDDFSLAVETAPENEIRMKSSPSHFHSTCELHLINHGETFLKGENTTCKATAGEMIIIPPMRYHDVENSEDVSKLALSVKISSNKAKSRIYQSLNKLFSAEQITVTEFGNIPELPELISICNSPASFSKKETEYLLKSYFTILFIKLAAVEEQSDTFLLSQNYTESILSFIVDNFSYPVGVGDLAEKLGLSVRHTEKIIKEKLKNTFTGLLNEYRVNIAKERIIDSTETSLEQIALSVGFNSYSYFYKQFVKHTHCSPANYRTKNKDS